MTALRYALALVGGVAFGTAALVAVMLLCAWAA